MNYLEEKTDGEAMIDSIQNGDHPLPVVNQVSLAKTTSNVPHPLKDKSMWIAEEKNNRKVDRLARSLFIQGLPNDIYSLIDNNNSAKELWEALERHMLGSEYVEQDRKVAVLYEYETFKATERDLFLDTYIRYLQVIDDLKNCGYKKDNCELNFKFLNNLQPEWKQYGIMMRQNKNLMDIIIDALYNILKQNQETKVTKSIEKVVVQSDSKGSDDEDISDLKNIVLFFAKAFNWKKYYAKPTNNNLRTSLAFSLANKKPEYVKSEKKIEYKKVDEKKRDMSKEINANMVFMAKMEKVLSDSEESSSSAKETIAEVSYYSSNSESQSEYETLEYYDNSNNYGLFVDNDDDQEIFHDASESACKFFNENHVVSQTDHDDSEVDHNDSEEKNHLLDKLIKKFNQKIAKCHKRIDKIVQICLWIIDSGCSKHMTGNRALLMNFVEKFLGTVRFGNNDFVVIAGYGDGLKVAFRKSTCFVQNEDGVDLLTGDRSLNLYTIALNEIASNSSACLLEKASFLKSWLWHQRLSHLNFATINNLVKSNLVRGLPKMKFEKDHFCSAWEQRKIH
nr:hypothetical protein [Tanacetum cinerariifolium]